MRGFPNGLYTRIHQKARTAVKYEAISVHHYTYLSAVLAARITAGHTSVSLCPATDL